MSDSRFSNNTVYTISAKPTEFQLRKISRYWKKQAQAACLSALASSVPPSTDNTDKYKHVLESVFSDIWCLYLPWRNQIKRYTFGCTANLHSCVIVTAVCTSDIVNILKYSIAVVVTGCLWALCKPLLDHRTVHLFMHSECDNIKTYK